MNVTSKGELMLGRVIGVIDDRLKALVKVYNYLLPTKAVDNIEACLYSKLIVNSCINSIAPLTGETVGKMLESKKAKLIFLEIAREGILVARKLGLHVPPYAKVLNYNLLLLSNGQWFKNICCLVVNVVGSKFGDVRPSTLQSLDRGEKTEIDIFNGYIVRKGREAGVPTPVNQQIYDFIKKIEAGEEKSCLENLERIQL